MLQQQQEPKKQRQRAVAEASSLRVEGSEERMLQRRVLHRLAQVGVHAPGRREDALDAGGRGGHIHGRNRQLTGGNTWLLKIPVTVVTVTEIPGAVSAR